MTKGRIVGAQVVHRAAEILKLFSRSQPELGLGEISDSLGLSPTTTYRILQALVEEGFVSQDSQTKSYRLGQAMIKLGEAAQRNFDLPKIALPHARHLAKLWGESTCVDVLNSQIEIVTVIDIPSQYLISHTNNYNLPLPPHCTSTGKAILAFIPESQLRLIMSRGLTSYTPKTITDPNALLEELEKIRSLGYATNIDELEIGLFAVGAPIWDAEGKVIAAISTGGPSSRITLEKISSMAEFVIEAADRISKDLGYEGYMNSKAERVMNLIPALSSGNDHHAV